MSDREPPQLADIIAGLRDLRLQGSLEQALEPAYQALARFSAAPTLAAELIRLLVGLGRGELALKLYQALGVQGQARSGIESEVLFRLALLLGRSGWEGECPPAQEGGWLGEYRRTGQDAARALRWRRIQVTVQSGPAAYRLQGACGHCGHRSWITLPVTLLVHREDICPACFGRRAISWQDIEAFLDENHEELRDLDISATDWDLIDAIRLRTQPGSEAPEAVRNLGQEYQFLLNEILAGRMLDGGREESERLP